MPRVLTLIFCFSLLVAYAWGPTGHRATGLIAERYLSAKAKKNIKRILGQESLAMASTWMDEIRSDSTYNHMTDWHWVTIETGKSYDESPKNKKGDIIMTLEKVINELKSRRLSPKDKKEYLKMLVHLIGDIHQPLHVGCCDDAGGNQVKVKWFSSSSDLHRVWDSDMIEGTQLSFTELADALGKPDATTKKKWQGAKVQDWAKESMDLRSQVYAIGDGNLGYKYSYKNLDTVKLRILQAGIRLAGVLNEIYK